MGMYVSEALSIVFQCPTFGHSKYDEYPKPNHQWQCEYCDAEFTTDYDCEIVYEANTEINLLYDKA